MNKFNLDSGFVTNLVLVSKDPQRIVVIVQNQHLHDGSRIYTAVDDSPDGIEVYTEKLEDLAERYDLPKELLHKEINKLQPKPKEDAEE